MKFNTEKFKSLISYIIRKCENKENAGKTVIVKLAYFSDFNFYELYEKSITGATYLKYERGPYPPYIDTLITNMMDNNEIIIKKEQFQGKDIYKYYLTYEPDTTLLTKDELATIDEVIDKYSDWTANRISEYSHGDMPWLAAEYNEELDYEFVFYRDEEYEAS